LKLVNNIKNAFKSNNLNCEIRRERGRIYLYVKEVSKGLEILKRIFGITSFSPVIKTTSKLDDISDIAVKISKTMIKNENSFALRVTRTGNHNFSSQDVAVKIGNVIVNATKAGVDLSNPDFELFIEIRNENTFFFTEKIRGTGGLPLGTQGTILALINTPQSLLAAWYLMRRGCDILFLKTNNQITRSLHSFITSWYVESDIIECDPKEKDLYKTVNIIASERSCDAVVTGHTIYDTSQDVLSDIKQLK
ncbi:unnamed protein product, partial [marine sediment metagenome]